jgi:AbrB family looped-hinge helix DNA binding protein
VPAGAARLLGIGPERTLAAARSVCCKHLTGAENSRTTILSRLYIEGEVQTLPEYLSSVSQKGQITLPIELRRQLGIKPKDQVTLQLEGDAVRVRPASFTLARVMGSVEPATRTDDFKRAERAAWEEQAEREARKLRGQ